ncbi:DUF6683 family protein [Allosphingosinicella deserti]|uniref:Uncharacterized protein n=1 Tax=Allosphingosinicella deserti TaxID=2116704 RepID=A0A2P7QGJ6_9SPHN|nr:DUF6683 family protein [Sphingomonas deserti]PSJ37036.1 hypothetical protein C7I55_23485 [Sphingomonas deserti]
MRKARFLGLIALAASVPAAAQGVFDMGMLTNTLSQGALIQSEEARAGTADMSQALARTPPSAKIDRAAITYRPSLAVRKRNLDAFVARLRRVDAAGAADLQRTFASRDVIAELGALMRPEGLDPSNVADAMATYLVTAFHGVRGSIDAKTPEFKAVSLQLARVLSADPAFTAASDALKQEIAESMLVQAVLADQAVQAAQKQPSAMPAVKAAIAKGAEAAFGFDVRRMQLGPNGLE